MIVDGTRQSDRAIEVVLAYYAAFNRGDAEAMLDLLTDDVVHGKYLAIDEGLPPANGQTYVLPGGAFFDVRDGLIARVSNYYNLEDWLAQVRG